MVGVPVSSFSACLGLWAECTPTLWFDLPESWDTTCAAATGEFFTHAILGVGVVVGWSDDISAKKMNPWNYGLLDLIYLLEILDPLEDWRENLMQTKRWEIDRHLNMLKKLNVGAQWSFFTQFCGKYDLVAICLLFSSTGLQNWDVKTSQPNNAFLCVPVFNSVFPRLFGGFVELAQFSGLRKGREIYGRTLIDSVFWEALIAVETKLTNPTSSVPLFVRRCATFCGLANTHGGSLSHLMANCWPNDTLGHCAVLLSYIAFVHISF